MEKIDSKNEENIKNKISNKIDKLSLNVYINKKISISFNDDIIQKTDTSVNKNNHFLNDEKNEGILNNQKFNKKTNNDNYKIPYSETKAIMKKKL